VSNPKWSKSESDAIAEIQEVVRRSTQVHAVGSKSKLGFHSDADNATIVAMDSLQGVVSYDPQEFVVTLLSGTRVAEVIELLANEGQYLPFDPLMADRAATIGGTVASNAAGSGRFRFGGIRDFLIGVRFIDGRGNCIRGGGQVDSTTQN
jgi:glycolate oxidase FAD binding subunit